MGQGSAETLCFTCWHTQGTVGAGLPIIGTLKHLLETGDKAQRVEGIFSGTLSYIFNSFGDGRPFSEIVAEAKANVSKTDVSWAVNGPSKHASTRCCSLCPEWHPAHKGNPCSTASPC